MDASQALRSARRRAGLSQRQLAAAAGITASAVGAYESGSRSPTVDVLRRLLAVVGLDLELGALLPPACPHLTSHLRLGLTARLHVALGGSGNVRHAPPAAWTRVWQVAAHHRVGVVGETAVGVWVPTGRPPARLVLTLGDDVEVPPDTSAVPGGGRFRRAPGPSAPDVVQVPVASRPRASVPVMFRGRPVHVAAPADLALDPDCRTWHGALRVAARELHTEGQIDRAGRREPAHRDPLHEWEAYRVFHTKRYGSLPMPADEQLRSWRLDAPVGFDDWLTTVGYPGPRRV